MNSSIDILDALVAHYGDIPDIKVAEKLGIPQSTISMVRVGKRKFPVDACCRAAEILQVDPLALIALVAVEGHESDAATEKARRSAIRSLKRARSAAAVFLLACLLGGAPTPSAHAQTAAQHEGGCLLC